MMFKNHVIVSLSFLVLAFVRVEASDTLIPKDSSPDSIFGGLVWQAKQAHVDYRGKLQGAARYNESDLTALFKVTDKTDGAGADLHCSYLNDLLYRFGDRDFARVLARESKAVRENVVDALDYSFLNCSDCRSWQRGSPGTYKLGSHRHIGLYRFQRSHQFDDFTDLPQLKLWRRAALLDESALATVFTVAANPLGDRKPSSAALQDLLRLFGDRRFARILTRQPATIRAHVVDLLDYAFRFNWSEEAPKTFRIAGHDQLPQYLPK